MCVGSVNLGRHPFLSARANWRIMAVVPGWSHRPDDSMCVRCVCVCVCGVCVCEKQRVGCPLLGLGKLIITTLQRLMKSRAIRIDTQTDTDTHMHTHAHT